ncbi:Alpha/Beta hydrolase protein [Fomes fomentarius]|nr:Alpha/Beta hydrolase protein [Fomes fomentarius]
MSAPKLHPGLAAALKTDPRFSQPPLPAPEGVSPIQHNRQIANITYSSLAKYCGERLPSETEYSVEDRLIPVENGEINLRIVRPTASASNSTYPVMVWFHGWALCDSNMDDNHLRTISTDLQLVTVNVEYRLVPEHPFPTPLEDCYAALTWVVTHAADIGVALDKGLIIGGDSAGGNLTASVALKARDDPFFARGAGNIITGQYLREPVLVHALAAIPDAYKPCWRSYEENKDAPLLTRDAMLLYFNLYGAAPDDLRVSPLLAPSFAGLPPTFLQIMELDPLRDDGVVYEKRLREAGIPVKIILNPGVGHGFHYIFPEIDATRKVDRDAREGLRWLLDLVKKSEHA